MFPRFNRFYSPDDSSGSNTGVINPPPTENKEDVIEFMKEEETDEKGEENLDLTKAPEKGDESKEGEEEKPTVEEEIEEELEEPDEEKLEFTTPARRSEILKAYPDLFKKFPSLERAYYREQKYTELYPTIKDAELAGQKAGTLDMVEKDVADGNLENIMRAMVRAGSFEKGVDEVLNTIHKINAPAYFHMAGNIIKHTIYSMAKSAQSTNNDELRKAALELNKYVFNTEDYTAPSRLAKEQPKKEEDTRLADERMQFDIQRFETANEALETKVNNLVKNTITKHIDPRDSMTAYVKDTAVEKALDDISEHLDNDRRFESVIQKLWGDARAKGYSRDSIKRIEDTFRSKIQTLLPSAIKKARQDALRGMGRRAAEEKEEEVTTRTSKSSSPKESRSHSNEDGPRPGESTYEYLKRTT
jgi:hypothetical protein